MNGDFGRSPFCGQLSGKLLLASAWLCIGTEIKAQGCVENLIRGLDRVARQAAARHDSLAAARSRSACSLLCHGRPGLLVAHRKIQHCLGCCVAHSTSATGQSLPWRSPAGAAAIPPGPDMRLRRGKRRFGPTADSRTAKSRVPDQSRRPQPTMHNTDTALSIDRSCNKCPKTEPRGRHHVVTLGGIISECPRRLRGKPQHEAHRTDRRLVRCCQARDLPCHGSMEHLSVSPFTAISGRRRRRSTCASPNE